MSVESKPPGSPSFHTIISTGHTGVEKMALQCARSAGLSTSGTTIGGTDAPSAKFIEKYSLKELEKPRSWERIRGKLRLIGGYHGCMMQNVDDSSVTIVFRLRSSTGLNGVVNYCAGGYFSEMGTRPFQPCLEVSQISDYRKAVREIELFLEKHKARVINVCGHRNDSTAGCDGYLDMVFRILSRLFERLAEKE